MTTSLGTFRALDHPFSIELDGTSPVDLSDVFGALAAEVEPTTTYRFVFPDPASDDGELFRNDDLIASGRARVLLQILITRLGQAIAQSDPGGSVHATTLRVGGGTALVVGASGRGKSTLSARLLLDGASLVAEDISVIDHDTLSVRTYHRPLGLTEASFVALGIAIPPAAGEPCGCGGKVLTTAGHLGTTLAPPSQPNVVALVDRSADVLRPLSPATALTRILEAGVAPTPDPGRDLDTLIRVLAGARCVEIGSADLGQAAHWITQMAADPRHDPVPTLVEQHGQRFDVYAGNEAVIVEADRSHLLNSSAAAVWLLNTEGLDPDAIAEELHTDRSMVDAAMAEFAGLL
ncbi:hypothetical protein [Actinospongicola halichondriae]|uniref:hypothetical protein n=1 Tax=Actinospongicola halichondriae TaxID=3236844 RepID=UPI003D5A355A